MHLFPWFKEEFRSPLPPAELLRRLQQATAPSSAVSAPYAEDAGLPFQGWLSGNSLRVSRISSSRGRRYQALTVMEGEACPSSDGGSRLQLLHRPTLAALLILGFWLVLSGTLLLVSLLGWLRNQPEYSSWGPTYCFLTIPTLFTLLFWWEVHKARRLLVPLLGLTRIAPA